MLPSNSASHEETVMPPTRPHEAAVSGRTKTSVGLKHKLATICNSDTILRAISELAMANTTYTSDTGKSYDFNTATKLNRLLVKVLLSTGQLMAGASYDLDFDHQFIETEKYDAKMTYKKFTGYSPGVVN
jgi:hypothetical protein